MTELYLNGKERAELEFLVRHSADARSVQRAYSVLWLDDGESIPEIATRLGVSRQSVYNWVTRFQERSDSSITVRIADGERSGRPRTALGIIDPYIEAVIDQDPREMGYGSTIWTAPVLVQFLAEEHSISVSDDSVRMAIARIQHRWKRPRHNLALRPYTWRQSKGG
ncbi:MAG: transposase [Candidatus Udaeobacter sp.]